MRNSSKTIVFVIVILVIAMAGYAVLTATDNRTPTQRVGDAVHDLDKGPDKAARQLESRTLGQKLGDNIKDATKPVNGQ